MAKAMRASIIGASNGSLQAIGSWAFLLGIFIAIIAGALLLTDKSNPALTTVTSFLVLLGTIVGLLNITRKETNSFLLASVVLVLVSGFGITVYSDVLKVGPYLQAMLVAILQFVVPATIIVALKAIFSLAERK